MRKVRKRVPEVLWKLFGKRAQSLAEALLSLIPPATLQCRCKGSRACLRCRSSDTERMSFLLREDDPSHYRTLLNHCFVVLFHTAPSPPPFDYHSRFSQIELVRKTIEMILSENISTKNVICTGYNKHKRSSTALEALTSSSWNLLLKRVGDGLMVHLLKHSLIFMPLNRKKHHQVAGIAINDLCWQHLKNHQHSSGVPERHHKADSVFMNIDIPESSLSCHGDSTVRVDLSQENGVLSRKRLRSRACRRKRKRRKLSSQYTKSSLPEKMKSLCSCCSVWQTLQKVSTKNQINKRPMLYKLERTSSILPEKHIINSLRPNACGANALFKDIFDVCSALQPTQCTHSNDTCVVGATCLYHSLHKRLKILIRKASHCPRVKLLNKHILDQSSTSEQSSELSCSKRQVVSFVWAACMNIIPRELLGNWRILRKNISKFIRLRIYEKFSLHQCMYKLKISDFQFLSAICNSGIIRKLLERWTYWVFAFIVVPLLQANFYVTESEHGKLQVFFYEKSVWEKLMKTSIGCLKDECYRLVNVTSVKQIVSCRRFGFSRVRFRPKANGIRPLANLKSSSRLQISHSIKEFKAVNVVLQDLHAALKDVQIKAPEKLGSSVFSYNDVHRNLRNFISRVKSGSSTLPRMYMVVADVQKAYDSIDQDKLLHLMKDVIVDDHLLHQTHQIIASNQHFQVLPYINLCKQFRSHAQSHSSHSIILDQGRSRIAAKDDLHFNLQQHVKNNLLYIDQRFYQQNVGIPQGSILSSLLCSFYFGHMETTKLVPFLDKITKSDFMLLRFIDDFLFISTSKKLALGFFSRLERGFCEYNCSMNKEKFGLSFDFGQIKSKLNWSDFDGNGNKFVRWSGLLINCKTLEVQADYTRLNIHQAFLLCAMKFHCYACDLSDICTFDSRSYLDIICKSLRYMYRLMKRRVFSMQVDPGLRPFIRVRRREVDWLGLTAYVEVLKRKQSRYNELLYLLELKLKSVTIESPDLKSAADKSNSSVLWKIKY
ncbi:putative RNA-directed DNA polymerase [Helianthus annuus]|uniref:Telomerase reverse transcriptase n=1 Tax=Helianthus annuus TaxID=4232 RepID=A0A9K3HJ87_HELAN|nr:telomerase reverse transcriptase isoform X15 [Helianthus annuus]KAF5779306.1 putative RNA-directed DNA polymerase [Helianthus annuus]KAJ0864038.1 putative RNA-directed DNA polymerase [Helianthus annuus]